MVRFVAALALTCLWAVPGGASAPTINASGDTGLTSTTVLPFVSAVYQNSWGASPSLAPANLFWDSGTFFTNADNMMAAQQWASGLAAEGIVPASGAQRWEDTYMAAQPPTPLEPDFVTIDRQNGCCSGPEFQAWVTWQQARPSLAIMASDGGPMPVEWRGWSGTWGHVSPLMPLAGSDCPPNMSSCTYGDWYAWRWGQTAALSGAYGVMLSDFSDSQPYQPSSVQGFNPAVVAAFASWTDLPVPGGTTAHQAAFITANAMPAWDDYLAAGYGNFFAALAARLAAATGQQSLVVEQCSTWAALRRLFGIDQRIFRHAISPHFYACVWDDQTVQVGRSGQDPVWGVGGYAVAAARTPQMRNGANLEAEDAAYWQAIAYFNPDLSPADQIERGLKLLRRSWLEGAWAHIATEKGGVRRALSFVSRDYWDVGTLDPIVQRLATTIYPTRPFGFAVYYSTAAERALEPSIAAPAANWLAYYNPNELYAFKNGGGPVNFYVSDAALDRLLPASAPAAWIVLEHPELIPAAEMATLRAIAPVLTSLAQAQSFAQAPLAFSTGLTGTGFYDQNGRLIVTVTKPEPQRGRRHGYRDHRSAGTCRWRLHDARSVRRPVRRLRGGGGRRVRARDRDALGYARLRHHA